MSLIGNGKSDVRNHFSTHRKANLHLVSKESEADAVGLSQEQVEVVKTNTTDSDVVSNPQSAVGSSATAVPTYLDEQAKSETPNS